MTTPVPTTPSRTPTPRWVYVLGAILLACVVGVIVAVAVGAGGSSEDAYIRDLDGHDIHYASRDSAIQEGHALCNESKSGMSYEEIKKRVESAGNGGADAAIIVHAAFDKLC